MNDRVRILVVDDDPVMLELACARLEQAGYTCETATNGAKALDRLQDQGADLVISDIDMPVMTGFELTKAIRADESLSATPVIVITSNDEEDAIDSAFDAGATSFLSKPIHWTLFTQAVKFVLKASSDQKELRSARDKAEAGARFKDGLMSVMSHELRTPLNAIIGFGQLLSEQFERENDYVHKEYSDYVVEGGRRLLNSVSDMLLASDARSGPIAVNDVDCTISELFELAISPLEKTIAAAQAEIKTVIKCDDTLEICCDRLLVARALGKLIDNAMKFSPRGVKIVLGAALTKTGQVVLLVKDDGPGVEASKALAVSQPFTQTDMSLRRSKEGLGLGLPLVQAIIGAHDGRFRLESEPGKGVRAYIVLPAARVSPSTASQTSPLSVAPGVRA